MIQLMALFFTLTFAQADVVRDLPALAARMDQAYLNDDIATIRTVRAALLRAITGTLPKDQEPLFRYAVAYADWRMVFAPSVAEGERDGLLDEAETQLQQAIKTDGKFAEAHALLGAVWGGKIAQSAIRGITLGPRVGSTMSRASSLEPDNPRIVLQDGIGTLNTPSMFGGGADKAEKLLRRAMMLFDKEPLDKAWPNWGRFDAHAWLGQALVERGDFAGARMEYNKALELAPNSKWLQYMLIPAMEKASKKKP